MRENIFKIIVFTTLFHSFLGEKAKQKPSGTERCLKKSLKIVTCQDGDLYSCDEESDIEGTDEAQEILPYQFEPEYTEEEILQLEAAGQGHGGGVEDRQQNTDW